MVTVDELMLQCRGDVQIATDVRAMLLCNNGRFVADNRFHDHEHAVEVELPLVQMAWPNAAVLPVEIPAPVKTRILSDRRRY